MLFLCSLRVWPAISARSRDRLPGAVPLRLHTSANSGIVWAHARQHDYHYLRRDFFPLHRDTCTYKLAKSALAEGPRDRAHTLTHTHSLGTPHRAAHFFTTTYTTQHCDPLVDHARASEELGRKDADRQKFLAVNSVSVIYRSLSFSILASSHDMSCNVFAARRLSRLPFGPDRDDVDLSSFVLGVHTTAAACPLLRGCLHRHRCMIV